MRGRYFKLGTVLLLLVMGSAAYTMVGMRLFAQYRVLAANFRGSCGSMITWSPPTQIYAAFYSNSPNLVVLHYRSATPQTLRITLGIPGFTQNETIEVQAQPGPQAIAFQPPLLGPSVQDALVGPGQEDAQLDLSLSHGATVFCETSIPVVIKSRQWMHWYDPVTGDNSRYLAGWVTPSDSVITTLIDKTARTLSDNPGQYPDATRLAGYDGGNASPLDVRAQVDAIFDTLQFQYHLRYAQDNVPYATDADQLIQLPKDILSNPAPTAMCVETTAIIASTVERLGMRPYFVIVPGHAFLGVALGPSAGAPIEYWETSDLNGGVRGDQANLHGDTEYNTFAATGKILRVVDVQYERAHGIMPIE